MSKVFVAGSNVITSLGFNAVSNAEKMLNFETGIKLWKDNTISDNPFYASRIENDQIERLGQSISAKNGLTRFEWLVIKSVESALVDSNIPVSDKDTVFILSTTKGNIDQLRTGVRLNLYESLEVIANYFNNSSKPLLISNACISGAAAVIIGKRLIQSGKFKHAVITGGDVVSEFTLSGFQSFKALCEGPCKPFDKDRSGLSLGEGAGTLILSSEESKSDGSGIFVAGGGISNDANHISGPSRTGDGLFLAISAGLQEAKGLVEKNDIGYLSSHGTATLYNDEMEAKAINLAGLENVPLNSLKGFIGHTLGAAGLIETVMGIYSLKNGTLFPSLGYQSHGVTKPLNVIKNVCEQNIKAFLKTTSGFGGCNAALVFGKE